ELIFGEPLDPGKYTVRFRYLNRTGRQEWTGVLETARVEFELVKPQDDD
ncbi:MAG: hypothetical protein IT162_16920, partial [Bryobacterales bacterium]|nr:hypothetical protein [Bryobacterales bacterium]